jgi:hypothetical protein
MYYNVRFYTDMGHLMLESIQKNEIIPDHIRKFAFEKADLYLFETTDTKGLGCRFYSLKSGYKNEWVYRCNNDIVRITYNVDKYEKDTMRHFTPYVKDNSDMYMLLRK